MTSPRVGVVVLNWNGWRDTLRCLDSLAPLARAGRVDVVVCDNGSSDDSWARLSAWNPGKVEVIQTGANLGFAGGMNVGIRHLLARGAREFLWLLNNDTEVSESALDALLACADQRPEVGVWGSTVADPEPPHRVQTAGGFRYTPWLTRLTPHFAGRPAAEVMKLPADAVRLDYVYGAAMLIRRQAFEQIGLLTEDYFLFYEELDFCRRLRTTNFQLGWCPASLVSHQGSATIHGDGARENRQRASYYENLNSLKFTARFHPRLLPVAWTARLVAKSLLLLARGQWDLFPPLFRAYRDFAQTSNRT